MKFEEAAKALAEMAPAMDAAWRHVAEDESIWQARIDGPAYRSTPILGHFRWYRRWRVVRLHAQLEEE